MEWLTKMLAITTLTFWKDPPVTSKGAALLFGSSTALLVCDRAAALGTEISASSTIVGLIITLLTVFAQAIGGYVSLLLMGQANLAENANKFIRLMALVWATSLLVFSHNFFLGPVFDKLPNDWCVAGLYSFASVGFFVVVAAFRARKEKASREEVIKLSLVSLVVFLVNAVFFYSFVLYTHANQVLTDNVNELILLFK